MNWIDIAYFKKWEWGAPHRECCQHNVMVGVEPEEREQLGVIS